MSGGRSKKRISSQNSKTSSRSIPQTSSRLGLAIIVATVALMVYLNAARGEFVWDDQSQILKNTTIRSFSNLPKAFTSGFWDFSPKNTVLTDYYRPFQTVVYMIAYDAGGLSPRPY